MLDQVGPLQVGVRSPAVHLDQRRGSGCRPRPRAAGRGTPGCSGRRSCGRKPPAAGRERPRGSGTGARRPSAAPPDRRRRRAGGVRPRRWRNSARTRSAPPRRSPETPEKTPPRFVTRVAAPPEAATDQRWCSPRSWYTNERRNPSPSQEGAETGRRWRRRTSAAAPPVRLPSRAGRGPRCPGTSTRGSAPRERPAGFPSGDHTGTVETARMDRVSLRSSPDTVSASQTSSAVHSARLLT